MSRNFKRFLIYGFSIGVLLAGWAFIIEPSWVRYPAYKLKINNWPQELTGLNIALIADPHVGSPHIDLEKLSEIVVEVNKREPDLVLLAGDYVIQGVLFGTHVESQEIANVLSDLKAPYKVFGVLGNHEHWENAPRIIKEFESVGIPMLEDKAVAIQTDNASFWLVGISDFYEGEHDIDKALKDVPEKSPIIALTHTPDIFPEIPARINFTLAGHTHGGQVYVPFMGRPVIPSKYGQRYAKGFIEEDGKQFFVSSGIGTSILPVRFMTPPEVSFLQLYPK